MAYSYRLHTNAAVCWFWAGEYCVECPNDGSVCLGGVTETQAAPGFWLYQSTASSSDSSTSSGLTSTASSVSFVVCSPADACVKGNTCAFGYEGDLVRV